MTTHFRNSSAIDRADAEKSKMAQRETSDWFIARLRPGKLALARENLARQAYHTFMPMRQVTLRRGARLSDALRPLFPGYLFVQIPPQRPSWRSINNTYGVAHLIALERNKPTRVPSDLMRLLFLGCGGEVWKPRAMDFFVGEEVRIVGGPFADAVARVEALPEGERIHVLLDIMGRAVKLSLAPQDLERLGG